MAITSIRCRVLDAHVTRVTDLEGAVVRVVCPELDESTRTCRLRKSSADSGPLGQLLERISENALDSRSTQCVLL